MSATPRRRSAYDTDATRMVGAGADPSEPRPHLVCKGCDSPRYIMALPMHVTMAVATIKAFVKIHRHCRATDATSGRDPERPSVGAAMQPRDTAAHNLPSADTAKSLAAAELDQ